MFTRLQTAKRARVRDFHRAHPTVSLGWSDAATRQSATLGTITNSGKNPERQRCEAIFPENLMAI